MSDQIVTALARVGWAIVVAAARCSISPSELLRQTIF